MKTKRKTGKEKLTDILTGFLNFNGVSEFKSHEVLNTFYVGELKNGKAVSTLFLSGNRIAQCYDNQVLKLFPCYEKAGGKLSRLTFSRLKLLNELAKELNISQSNIRNERGVLVRSHPFGGEFKLSLDYFGYEPRPEDTYFVV